GNVYFNGHIHGTSSEKQNPTIAFNFGCRNASFFQPEYREKLENISLDGSFTNGKKQNLQTSVIELKNLRGNLRGRPFSGNLTYRNFSDPHLKLDLKADLDIAHVLGLFPQEEIRNGSGTAKLKFGFDGNLKAFQARPANQALKTSGELELKNANLLLKAYREPFSNLNGHFMLRRSDVAVSDFSGKLGSSDFKLNGYFKNMLGWLLLSDQNLLVQADLDAGYLNFDELLAGSVTAGTASQSPATATAGEYAFAVSPQLNFDLNARVKKLKFRRFNSKDIKGTVRLKDQIVSTPNISFSVAGGRFSVNGLVDARKRNNVMARTNAWLEDIHVDSLFYVFENFGQDFLQQRHLKGELTANIHSDLYFDRHLNPLTDKVEADIKVTMINGQLLNFEPLQKLSAFVNRSELANLRFSDLTNHFWIQNRTVYLPEMDIRSNVSRVALISFSGTHTFDQQMDYRFKIPLAKGEKRPDKDEAFGRVEQVSTANPNLFLTLKGNENNYKIAYDQERVKGKLKDDLRREKQELTDALRGRQQKEKAVEIKQDEFFNF
ncbi:MAG TPA: AsmA-like C-terminal region-containing protein, partial [Adhaeribacter sp.]|nr:AsmA-like C-terminal region-containing protein [Adhaeribacter sp.]